MVFHCCRLGGRFPVLLFICCAGRTGHDRMGPPGIGGARRAARPSCSPVRRHGPAVSTLAFIRARRRRTEPSTGQRARVHGGGPRIASRERIFIVHPPDWVVERGSRWRRGVSGGGIVRSSVFYGDRWICIGIFPIGVRLEWVAGEMRRGRLRIAIVVGCRDRVVVGRSVMIDVPPALSTLGRGWRPPVVAAEEW